MTIEAQYAVHLIKAGPNDAWALMGILGLEPGPYIINDPMGVMRPIQGPATDEEFKARFHRERPGSQGLVRGH